MPELVTDDRRLSRWWGIRGDYEIVLFGEVDPDTGRPVRSELVMH